MILAQERARPARVRDWPHAWVLAVITVCFGAFMGQLDASIVTLTYRPIGHDFGASPAAVQWVSLSYLITLVALLVPVGRRSDQRGRKLSYLHGFVVFTAGSVACGLAPDLWALVAARTLQGAGAALLQANSVALVASAAPRGRLRSALGLQAAAQALGLAAGPTVGGVIVAELGWRWVFAINAPVGAVAIAAGVLFLPRSTSRAPRRPIDARGSLLLAVSSSALLLTLSALSGWRLAAFVPGLLGAAALSAALALRFSERKAPEPLLIPELLRPRTRAALVTALCSYMVLFGPLVAVPSLLEQRGWSALASGLVLSALPAGFAFGATASGARVHHWTDHQRAATGALVAAVVLVVTLFIPYNAAWLAPSLAALGIGLGVLAPANNSTVLRAVRPDETATAGGVLNITRGLGTALGISVVTLAYHAGGGRLVFLALLVAALGGLAAARSAPDPVRRGPGATAHRP